MATLAEYLDYLIPPPNKIQPKFMAWVEANLTLYTNMQTCIAEFVTAFDIETAVGDQLDILGQIMGRSRTVDFEPTYDSPVLDDENYRIILKAKIIQNQWNGTKPEIYAFWQQYFPDRPLIVIDNQDMTIDVAVFNMNSTLQQELVENFYYFPKPAGVLVNFAFSNDPLFAWNSDSDYLKGYGEGYWAEA